MQPSLTKVIVIACAFTAVLAVTQESAETTARNDAQTVKGKVQMQVSSQAHSRRLQASPGSIRTGFSTDPQADQSMKEAIAGMAQTKVANVQTHSTEASSMSGRRLAGSVSDFVNTAYTVSADNASHAAAIRSSLQSQSPSDVETAVKSRLQANGLSAGGRRLQAEKGQYNISCNDHQIAQAVAGHFKVTVTNTNARRLTVGSSISSKGFVQDDKAHQSVKETVAKAAVTDASKVTTSSKETPTKHGRRLATSNSSVDVDYWIEAWSDMEAESLRKNLNNFPPQLLTELMAERLQANGGTQYIVIATEHTVETSGKGINWLYVVIPVALVAGIAAVGVVFFNKKGKKKTTRGGKFEEVPTEEESEETVSQPQAQAVQMQAMPMMPQLMYQTPGFQPAQQQFAYNSPMTSQVYTTAAPAAYYQVPAAAYPGGPYTAAPAAYYAPQA